MNIPTTKLPLNALTPHPENYNTHPASQIKELAESLATFGQFKNIVTWTCPENMTTPEGHELHEGLTYILAGHGLWLAAMEAGVDELEVKDYSGISYGMAIGLLLIDNAAPLGSEPDVQRLAALLVRAREPMADKPRLAEMLERLRLKAGMNGNGHEPKDVEPQIDKAAELQKVWGVKVGDVWELGQHRLVCGDCTDRAVVESVMRGERAQACITDPPYGTASDSKVQKRGNRIETFDIEWDKDAPLGWIPILHEYLDEGGAVISFWENAGITTLWETLKSNGFNTLHTVYWEKTTVPQPRPNFCSSVESSVFARKPGKVLCWNGGGATPNVFNANRAAGNERTPHETQKPLTLFSWLIELVTAKEFIVYDPFLGSGTTLIAAHQLNRRCFGIEIEPSYCAVTLERWSQLTGQTPRRVSG